MRNPSFVRADLRPILTRLALVTVVTTAHAEEQIVDPPDGAANIDVAIGDSVWFDSENTNDPVPLDTINGSAPETGVLPGWAHTQWSFMKYDGTDVLEIPLEEQVVGAANLATADASSYYYDDEAATDLNADQTIGLVETTRDFRINDGARLDVALGGLMFHNANHWVKVDSGAGFLTSSSGQLTVIANGGQSDCRVNGVVIEDFDDSTPLSVVKTGGDSMYFTAPNTYSGGTWIHNGRLRATNTLSYGETETTVMVDGENAQANLAASGNFNYDFDLSGLGWTEGGGTLGALRVENAATITGNVTLSELARITVDTGVTGTLEGDLTGTADLEIGTDGAEPPAGTLDLNGSGSGMTGLVSMLSGRLNVNSELGAPILVFGGATLGGEGTVNNDVELGDTGEPSRLAVDGVSPEALEITGEVDLSFGPTDVIVEDFPAPPETSFTAFTYGSLVGDPGNLNVNLRDGVATDDAANSRVVIEYTPGMLTWTGSENAEWAESDDTNFEDGGGQATNFLAGDHVSFTEAAAEKAVTIIDTVRPSSVSFDHESEYTVGGEAAGISGPTGITKDGTGTLILNGQTSDFTGPIDVNAGVLRCGGYWEAFGYSSGITVADGAQVDINGSQPVNVGDRLYSYTVVGDGPDGLGAITNSADGASFSSAGINELTLTGDASVGGDGGRIDIGVPGNDPTVTGDGHTLTKVGTSEMGFRADASGSPIDIVLAGGTAWAENTDAAWGGAGGTLRIQDGARGGTYGTRAIETPVFLEAGGTLHNQGGGTATWNGDVTLEGDAMIDSGTTIEVYGTVTGDHSLTKTGGQETYLDDPQYGGDTTVETSQLTLAAATLADDSTVSLGATGVLGLEHGSTDTVEYLVIDGVPQAPGTYGATGSGAENIDDAHFAGTGVLDVTSEADFYASWESDNGIAGEGPEVDSNQNGVPNGIEFVIGGDPVAPGAGSSGLLPSVTVGEAYLDFVFRRSDESASYNPYVEYGSDLGGWTTAVDGENGILILEENDAAEPGVDLVTVSIPRDLAADSSIFARLVFELP